MRLTDKRIDKNISQGTLNVSNPGLRCELMEETLKVGQLELKR